MSRFEIETTQFRFRQVLKLIGTGADQTNSMETVNEIFETNDACNPQLTFHLAGPRGTPRLMLKSQTLYAFMMMEVAMIVGHGVRVTECENCSTVFLTGPLTWRRAHA